MSIDSPLEPGIELRVWYAAYGSSLLLDRFMWYLEGRAFQKTPNARVPKKCDAGTQIGDVQPYTLPFKLYFAHESRDWGGGGVAFVGTEETTYPQTLGRAYLLTLSRLVCLAREQNVCTIKYQNLKQKNYVLFVKGI